MKNYLVDSRDVRFVLFEMLEIDRILQYPEYADFDRDIFEETLNLAETISVEEFYPVDKEGDREGVKYNPATGTVAVPECYRAPYAAITGAGFIGISESIDHGGMGMPLSLSVPCKEYFCSGNATVSFYTLLASSVAGLIANFGTETQKELYLEKILQGTWGGTMCLTEPESGSDVGSLKARAEEEEDGTYKIYGQKIFISAGEHNLTENIIHMVLARIEGDPPGTKGISLFVVPKYLVNPDGSLSERNDLVCTGTEHKMGFHGHATCSLSFGDNGGCLGYLLGEPRKGMKVMFQMMNEERLYVGLQALATSGNAYLHAAAYAKNRHQGADITRALDPAAPRVPIIQHPDVKRMLLWMKSYVEGMRMLTYFLAQNLDYEKTLLTADAEGAAEAHALVELLIPLCKAGNSDMVWLITSEAIQVFGGNGFCTEYPVAHLANGSKGLAIVEGTNGIQSIDLVMRKILMNKEQYNYTVFVKRVTAACAAARGVVHEKYITPVERGLRRLDEVIDLLKDEMKEMKIPHILMNATALQQAMFMLSLAWMHLWSLTLVIPKTEETLAGSAGPEQEAILRENPEAAYYYGKRLSSQFYIGTEFPKFFGKIESILTNDASVLDAAPEVFTGAPEE
ncbi:MAG: acyl-CoA dehydrogenase [bacterium]|nr:acyl-CoA dehydrogenase [bacterium]